MSLFKKILTAIRGGAREAGEAFVEANSIRIFEQEIKDAKNHLDKAKQDLTTVMAQEMQASRKAQALLEDITKHESYVAQALEKGDEGLALDIAQKIADLQKEQALQQAAQEKFSAHAERLKAMIKKTTVSLADMERQLVMVKTTENVQKATTAITDNYASGSSSLLTAKESLDRIQERQQQLDDRLAAGDALDAEFNGNDLETKMKEAGILEGDSKAQDILAQIKAKKGA